MVSDDRLPMLLGSEPVRLFVSNVLLSTQTAGQWRHESSAQAAAVRKEAHKYVSAVMLPMAAGMVPVKLLLRSTLRRTQCRMSHMQAVSTATRRQRNGARAKQAAQSVVSRTLRVRTSW
jgi:hypothetical protein